MADIIGIKNGEKVSASMTSPDVAAAGVIERAGEADFEHAVVIGWKRTGEFYLESSHGNAAEVVFLLELAKHTLLSGAFEDDES